MKIAKKIVRYEIKELNPEINFLIENIEITAWNDEGSAHIDKYFQLI